MINFKYKKEEVTTLDKIEISVADLRDLLQGASLKNEDEAIKELNLILFQVCRKNRLSNDTFQVEK